MTLCFVDTETTGLDPDVHEVWEVAVILRGRPPDPLIGELLERMTEPRRPRPDPGGREDLPDAEAASIVPLLIREPGDEMYVWQLPVDLARADPMALSMNGFHERRWGVGLLDDDLPEPFNHQPVPGVAVPRVVHPGRLGDWCRHFAELTWGAHMVGIVPSFDTDRLHRLLRRNGACPGWHYQPIDVETAVYGWLQGRAEHDGGQWKSWHAPGDLDPPWDSDALSRLVGVDPEKYDRHSAMGDACWARDVWEAIQPTTWNAPIEAGQ